MTAPASGLLGAQGVFKALRALTGWPEGAGRRWDAAGARQGPGSPCLAICVSALTGLPR